MVIKTTAVHPGTVVTAKKKKEYYLPKNMSGAQFREWKRTHKIK